MQIFLQKYSKKSHPVDGMQGSAINERSDRAQGQTIGEPWAKARREFFARGSGAAGKGKVVWLFLNEAERNFRKIGAAKVWVRVRECRFVRHSKGRSDEREMRKESD